MIKTITKYQCGQCNEIYKFELNAEDCCKPEIDEIEFYVCDKCEEEYETEKEAFECCDQTRLKLKEIMVKHAS